MSRRQENMLSEFMAQEASAPWVRALSDHQMNQVLKLRPALRDDIAQGTCYRVHRILINIGIKPLIASKLLRKFIKISRGNDLAFLYFILEGFYKTECSGDGNYSLNEKNIMSAIAILDVPYTLTALDVILPPAPSKQSKAAQQAKPKKKPKEFNTRMSVFEKTESPIKTPERLPYLQKLPRPKITKVRLYCKMPNYRVRKSFFKEFPMRANDSDRWFAKYELQPSLRVVKRTIENAVNQLFDDDAATAADNGSSPEVSLCAHHRFWAEEAKNIKEALNVAAKERCLNIIDTEAYKNHMRLTHILKQLGEDIDWHTAKYKRIAQVQLTETQMIYKNCGADCEMCQTLVSTLAMPHDMRVLYGDKDVERHATMATNNVITLSGPNKVMKNVQDDDINNEKKTQKTFKRLKANRSVCMNGKHKNTRRMNGLRLINQPKKTEGKQERKLFKAPTLNKPHYFDYMHIFPTKGKQSSNTKLIQNTCLNALHRKPSRSDQGSLYGVERRETCQTYRPGEKVKPAPRESVEYIPPDWSISSEGASRVVINDVSYAGKKAKIMNEVVNCAKRIVHQKLEQQRIDELRKQQKLRLTEEDQLPKLKYADIEHFDPDNDKLMDRMLQDALNILKKERRFIIAAFPEAHKLRSLREWIKHRYGKIYSRADINKSFRRSFMIFGAIMRLQKKTRPVDTLGMKINEVNYNEYNKTMKLGRLITERYHKILNDDLMDQTAFCWFAMDAHLWARGPPTDLFYSYLPSNVSEVNRMHPWY